MAEHGRWELPNGRIVRTLFSDRGDGDLSPRCDPGSLRVRRGRLAPGPWTWLHQVHGARCVVVRHPGEHAGQSADASVTSVPGAVLCVQTADCAPVMLWSPAGEGAVVSAVHAGWRGLMDGVVTSAVESMAGLGAELSTIEWTVGPCISPEAYEFSEGDLEALVGVLGPGVRSRSRSGAPAFDLRAGVAAALADCGVGPGPAGAEPVCTRASPTHWSHRADGSVSRQVGAIWWESGA